jgi:hypothetical protein
MRDAAAAAHERRVARLLARSGRTFCEELGIDIRSGEPGALFRLLCMAIVCGARINAKIALRATAALAERGWTTAAAMAAAPGQERAQALNRAGYARSDERTARHLGATAEMLMRECEGDLRVLRAQAGHDPAAERRALKRCKGLGDVGVDIFFRETQAVWDELYPFADARALDAAARLDLGRNAEALSRAVPQDDFPRLVAALVRTALTGDFDPLTREEK